MSVFTGLAALRKAETERAAASANRVNWVKVEADESVKIVFLQELDESSERYIEDNGLVIFAQEHANPAQFFRRVVCTNNEDHDGQCWPCQENKRLWDANVNIENDDEKYKGGWKPKTNMYINVLVRREGKDDEVAVLSRPHNDKSYTHQLIEDAVDEGFISNVEYRLTRSGEGFDTTYRLKRLKDANLDLTEYTDQIVGTDRLLTEVGFEAQPAALGVTVAKSVSVPSTDEDEEFSDDDDDWI